MKQSLLLLLALLTRFAVLAQDATQVYRKTVDATVTIETETSLGSGFLVAPGIIATNYHVIEGNRVAFCYTNGSGGRHRVDGYLAVDSVADLVLLQVSTLRPTPLPLAQPGLQPGQRLFVMGSPKGLPATISDGIVSGLRNFGGRELIQMTAPVSPGSSGGPVLNEQGAVIGVAVLSRTDGQNLNFAVPLSALTTLLRSRRSTPLPLAALLVQPVDTSPLLSADRILELGIVTPDRPGLRLDYLASQADKTVLFFTYTHQSDNQRYQTVWMDDYRLVDNQSGRVYHATSTDLPRQSAPRIIYKGTQSHFRVVFDRIPDSVQRFSLLEGDCTATSFCFPDIDLHDFDAVDQTDLDAYADTADEGTVTFYSTYGQGGTISFTVEGYDVGSLSQYFNGNTSPDCGQEGTITLRLNSGTYNYTASNSTYHWQGQFTITKNGCTRQGISGR